MNTTTSKSSVFASKQVSDWFEQLISQIKVDQLQLEVGVADTDKSEFYKNAIFGSHEDVFKKIRFEASQFLIERVVKSFLLELSTRKAIPKKLAFSLTPATIMVWAEIDDDNEQVEDEILLAEAKVNAYARQYDFSLDTMIVEKSDALPIPSHYTSVS
jgi:hypothetical protein